MFPRTRDAAEADTVNAEIAEDARVFALPIVCAVIVPISVQTAVALTRLRETEDANFVVEEVTDARTRARPDEAAIANLYAAAAILPLVLAVAAERTTRVETAAVRDCALPTACACRNK